MDKEHLIPELIKDLVKKFENTKNINEYFVMEERLREISKYLTTVLGRRHKYIQVK